MIDNKLMVSLLLALVIIYLAHISLINAESQDPNTTSITIEDKIERIMGNSITKMMDDTIDMIKNANSTAIVNHPENAIDPITNVTDVNKAHIRSLNESEKLGQNNIASDSISKYIPNASVSEELEKNQIGNITTNERGIVIPKEQNTSSTVNTTQNTPDINQKIINNADNKTSATTTDKPTNRNNMENFFTQIGQAVKKFFGGN
jgi:hypothetical protein